MHLKRVAIRRLGGITTPFAVDLEGDGIHVIVGPNETGKSSICRAVECLYWQDRHDGPPPRIDGRFEHDGIVWQARRDGPHLAWSCPDEGGVPPRLPDSRHDRSFFLRLRDLTDPSADGPLDIASRIRREMSGGIDLDGLVQTLFRPPTRHACRVARKAFNESAKRVRTTQGRHARLQRDMDRLKELEDELETAVNNDRRRASVRRARKLADHRGQLADTRQKVSVLPAALEQLTGTEPEDISARAERARRLEARIRAQERVLSDARTARQGTHLESVIALADLALWHQRANDLAAIEMELREAWKIREERLRELGQALEAVGGSAEMVDLVPDDHARLFEALRMAEKHRLASDALQSRIDLLRRLQDGGVPDEAPESLRVEVDLLRRWLRSSASLRKRAWLVAVLVAVVTGALLAFLADPIFGLLAAAGVGVSLPVLASRPGDGPVVDEEFARLGLVPPRDAGSATVRLTTLETDLASFEARRQRRRDRDVELRKLESEHASLAARTPPLEELARPFLKESGRFPSHVELLNLADALVRLRQARIASEGADGLVSHLEARHDDMLSELAAFLCRHGETTPRDAREALARLDSLGQRSAALESALKDEAQASTSLDEASRDHADLLEEVAAVYRKACLEDGDTTALAVLVDSLPRYRELVTSARELENLIKRETDELAADGEGELAGYGIADLDGLDRELSGAQERASSLRQDIAEIRAEVAEVRRTHHLEEQLAIREQARSTLQERRNEALFAACGRFLIDTVEQEFESIRMPRLLARTRHHFSEFTRHRHDVRLSRDGDPPRLIATDLGSDESRELDELSDGTRAQLLLAARVAFASEIEGDTRFPFLLDEALDQSDPERFDAIAGSLGDMAQRDCRQIIYLTSDPLDVGRFRRAIGSGGASVNAIDLGAIRQQTAMTGSVDVPPLENIPHPETLSPQDYAAVLAVPHLRPERGWRGQHLHHVLWDRPHVLHDILCEGIRLAGQWKHVSPSPLGEKLRSMASGGDVIDARVDLFAIFTSLWNEGRNRPVDRDALKRSNAVSGHYLEPLVMVAESLAGDPRALLDTLRSNRPPALARFRARSAGDLEAWLRDHGYLDERPRLDREELALRALASPPAARLPQGDARSCLHHWWFLAEGAPPA
ncbi:MAG: AAA family ATPase [bacterium]|nr:AAA family ATPase [bacterium]